MKAVFFLMPLFPFFATAQKLSLQAGPSFSFAKNNLYGAQFIPTVQVSKTVELGAGVSVMQPKGEDKPYLPIYAVVKLNIPVNLFALTFDAYPGHNIYNKQNTTDGFYFSSGITITSHKNTAPYISLHYTKYEYHETNPGTGIKQTNGTPAFTLSAGIQISFKKN